MREFPSCFGENAVQVADFSSSSSSKISQNLVICVYQCRLLGRSCFITITWSKNLMGQGLSVGIDDNANQCICKIEIKAWLFSKKKGSKTVEACSNKIDIYWGFSSAKFGSGPEPLEGYYLGIVSKQKMVLLVGDMNNEALKKTSVHKFPSNAIFISKREHIFGKKVYTTKARFCDQGKVHDLTIECDMNGANTCLVVRIDTKIAMKVNQLQWKFRGNHTIVVNGIAVEVFWDVYNWFFSTPLGNAVFMFKTEALSEKIWARQPLSDDFHTMPWSWSQRFSNSQSPDLGFSLVLFAWRSE